MRIASILTSASSAIGRQRPHMILIIVSGHFQKEKGQAVSLSARRMVMMSKRNISHAYMQSI